MNCCGQKRLALTTQMTRPMPAKTRQQPVVLANPTTLMYLGDSSTVVSGSHTGFSYLFASRGKTLSVDARDVAGLLATGRFSRVK
jgi:hypothetical protein